MRIRVIVNRRAGAVLNTATGDLEDVIAGTLSAHGHAADVTFADPQDMPQAIRQSLATPVDALVIGGGDGTVRAAAEHLMGRDVALGILPLGTLNRLARDLDIPLTLPEAVDALARGSVRPIDVGDVNGRIFLCNSLIGLPLTFAEGRAAVRGAPLLQRANRYFDLVFRMLRSTQKLSVQVDDGERPHRLRAISVVISNNPYAETTNPMLKRSALDGGQLGIYLSRHHNGRAMLWAVLKAMVGVWRGDPDVENLVARDVTLRFARRRVKVSNDGEVETLRSPLRYSISPRSLNILMPAGSHARPAI